MYYKLALLTSIFSWTWFTCACSSVGPCPKLEGVRDVNLTKFAGHWYEIERSFYLMELIRSCVSIDLTKVTDTSLAVVVNTKITWTDLFSISKGNASRSRKDPSVFFYRVSCGLPGNLNRYLPGSGHYRILKTDYVNYAVIYSCTDFKVVHLDMIWIWGRKNEIGPALRSEIYSMLSDNHLDSERLILSKNKNCTDD